MGDAGDRWTIIGGREFARTAHSVVYTRASPTGEACNFYVDRGLRQIVVDLPIGAWRQLFVLRMIRNVLRWELFREGAIFLHACCVEREGKGIIFLGRSRSGKTTLTLNLIRNRGWQFVAEDDLTLFRLPGRQLLALGWPGCLRMRRSMLAFYPELVAKASEFAHPANSLEQNLDPEHALLRIFPEELNQSLGCQVAPQVVPKAFVWVKWGACQTMRPIPAQETLERLFQSWDILPERKPGVRPDASNAKSSTWSKFVFDQFLLGHYQVPDLHPHKETLRVIAGNVPAYSLTHCGGDVSHEITSIIET